MVWNPLEQQMPGLPMIHDVVTLDGFGQGRLYVVDVVQLAEATALQETVRFVGVRVSCVA
jgi:hypothetical protein